jgi:hypothetical protein
VDSEEGTTGTRATNGTLKNLLGTQNLFSKNRFDDT